MGDSLEWVLVACAIQNLCHPERSATTSKDPAVKDQPANLAHVNRL